MNKKLMLSTILAAGSLLPASAQTKPAIPSDPAVEARIEQILGRLTLEEKIGQMTEITVDVVTDWSSPEDFKLSDEKLSEIIGKYKVGSILNVPLSIAQTPEKWAESIRKIQEVSMRTIGIPCVYGVDQIHGTTYTLGGTLFPQGINMAAAFNRSLMRRAAEINAYETRACCIPWSYGPVTDLGRVPMWPRMWESFGEDAYLNAEMGREALLGLQGDNPNRIDEWHVAGSVKHFMAYGMPVSGKDRTPSSVPVTDMREKHFAPYLAALRAGALSIMVNSAVNNGIPFHCNAELLTQWVKEDLNWDGLIVTDWADINNIALRDHVAATKKDAVCMAINAGIDMSMVPYETSFCTDLRELVEEGRVPMSRIDDAVRRVLRMKFRLGLFENPYWDIKKYDKFGSEEHAAAALQAAEESQVLLKNEGNLLPLKPGTRILLTGPNAHTMRALNGGWSYTWQGERADEPQCTARYNTILEALQNKFGKEQVVYEPALAYRTGKGSLYWQEVPEGVSPKVEPEVYGTTEEWPEETLKAAYAKAVRAAEGVDVIVCCIGENSYCETPGNLTDLTLSPAQQALVKSLAATGKPVVLVLNEGRPRIINRIERHAQAIVDILLPGNYGGDALANLLSGDANFSARLPFTYPRLINSLATYDYKPCENVGQMDGNYNYDAVMDVQWEFGHGLSYTTFAYDNLRVSQKHFTAADTIEVSVDVKNTGKRKGKESVLLFSSDLVATLTPDNRRLRGFEKVELAPGETRTVTIKLPATALAFVNTDGHWLLEQGDFRIACGELSTVVTCDETRRWESPNI